MPNNHELTMAIDEPDLQCANVPLEPDVMIVDDQTVPSEAAAHLTAS